MNERGGLCLLIELCMTARRWEYYWNIRPCEQLCRKLPFSEYKIVCMRTSVSVAIMINGKAIFKLSC